MNKLTEAAAIAKDADVCLRSLAHASATDTDRFILKGNAHENRIVLQERLFRLDRNMKRMLIRLIANESGVNIRQTGMHTTRALYSVSFADDETILRCLLKAAINFHAQYKETQWQDQSTTS